MNVPRRACVSASLLAALVAVLAFAATASAEIRSAESTSPLIFGTPSPEITAVKATVSYDTAGTVVFTLTTAAPPQESLGGESNPALIRAELGKASQCTLASTEPFGRPIALAESRYGETSVFLSGLSSLTVGEELIPATKTVSGATTTISMSSATLANLSFNCAIVSAQEKEEEGEEGEEGEIARSGMIIPLGGRPAPPAPPPSGSTSTSSGSTAPPPAPAALSIAKLKPTEIKVGKWKTIKVKVSNPGGITTAAGSFKLKPTKGVLVKPESQKLPELAPGTSWTLSVRVQVTEKAKPKSTLSVKATASGLTATGSLVVKRDPTAKTS
jgi:hypothetical protein